MAFREEFEKKLLEVKIKYTENGYFSREEMEPFEAGDISGIEESLNVKFPFALDCFFRIFGGRFGEIHLHSLYDLTDLHLGYLEALEEGFISFRLPEGMLLLGNYDSLQYWYCDPSVEDSVVYIYMNGQHEAGGKLSDFILSFLYYLEEEIKESGTLVSSYIVKQK